VIDEDGTGYGVGSMAGGLGDGAVVHDSVGDCVGVPSAPGKYAILGERRQADTGRQDYRQRDASVCGKACPAHEKGPAYFRTMRTGH
jgi:hypothetical protein